MMAGHRSGRSVFFDCLAYTGCVRDAARVAGLSAVAAYRMKRQYPAFKAAFDAALGRAQTGLIALAYKRAVEGNETVVVRKGEEYERRITPSDAMLALLIKRGDMAGGGKGASNEEMLTLDEWRAHWRLSDWGQKIQIEDPVESKRRFVEKMAQVKARLKARAAAGGTCTHCDQKLPADWPGESMAHLVAAGVVDMAELN